jgi:hypothetical protein
LAALSLTRIPVWLLRSWKLQQLELLGLDEKREAQQTLSPSMPKEISVAPRRPGQFFAYLRGMTVIKKV